MTTLGDSWVSIPNFYPSIVRRVVRFDEGILLHLTIKIIWIFIIQKTHVSVISYVTFRCVYMPGLVTHCYARVNMSTEENDKLTMLVSGVNFFRHGRSVYSSVQFVKGIPW